MPQIFVALDKIKPAYDITYRSRQDLCAKLFAGSGRPEVSRQ